MYGFMTSFIAHLVCTGLLSYAAHGNVDAIKFEVSRHGIFSITNDLFRKASKSHESLKLMATETSFHKSDFHRKFQEIWSVLLKCHYHITDNV
jgi:hypothetical protein